jgi:hypothetical protein
MVGTAEIQAIVARLECQLPGGFERWRPCLSADAACPNAGLRVAERMSSHRTFWVCQLN